MDVVYRRWIVANGWGEAVGLGTTFLVGICVAPFFDQATDVLTVLAGTLLAVLFGTLLEGVVVGVAQAQVLRRAFVGLRPYTWVVATTMGAGLAWLVGMIPSMAMALYPPEAAGTPSLGPSAILQYTLAAVLGFMVGPILGCAQWAVLRRHVRGASRWLWAHALAWAVGMPLVFLGMDYVPWSGHAVVRILAIYTVCGACGLVVGAIHGRVLLRLLREPIVVSNHLEYPCHPDSAGRGAS